MMSISEQIKELVDAGMTQIKIQEKTNLTQSKISRLASGATKRPSWDDGMVIKNLHQFVVLENNHWDEYEINEVTDEM